MNTKTSQNQKKGRKPGGENPRPNRKPETRRPPSKTNPERAYRDLVLNPLSKPAAKIPSPFPIPTHLSQTKIGIGAATGAGNTIIILKPHYDTSVLLTSSSAGGSAINDFHTMSSLTWAASVPTSILNFAARRRVVAAGLEIEITAANSTRCGSAVAAYIPYNIVNSATFSMDSLRDLPTSRKITISSNPKIGCRYAPQDPSALDYRPVNTGPGGGGGDHLALDSPCLAIFITGTSSATSFIITARIIHEFIPNGNVTDLLLPEPGPRTSLSTMELLPASEW